MSPNELETEIGFGSASLLTTTSVLLSDGERLVFLHKFNVVSSCLEFRALNDGK